MFKLRRLEITGFKSFADHTDLIFTGEGITAVVGPNGCGKSNVADAIAWVLGEQRVKHLRGADMKDVIFQGSRNRPPSGMSEVILHLVRDEYVECEPDIEDIDSTLEQIDEHAEVFEAIEGVSEPGAVATGSDNSTGQSASLVIQGAPQDPVATTTPSGLPAWGPRPATGSDTDAPATPDALPDQAKSKAPHKRHWRRRNPALEFAPGEAVSVTRRLYRSGESEYLLNDRACRLRDIQDLFSGTGLAGGHYAIIEQGRIGQILSAKPMDRRTIIEEAAGITKFRVRQRAAEARLESARSNLSRVSDIIAEIERQVNSLRRQAAKARRYRIQREELRELLRHVYVGEERSLAALLARTQAELDSATEDDQRLTVELAQRDEGSRAATQDARTLEDELGQVRAAVSDAALQRDRRIRERVYQAEQIENLTKRRAEIQREVEALSARLVTIESELERLREADARLSAENEQTTSALRQAEESHAQSLTDVATAEEEIEAARAELLTHTVAAERLSELARQLENALEKLEQQAEGLAREGERANAAYTERSAEAEKLSQEVAATREKLAKLVAERVAAIKAVVDGHERVADTDAEQTRVRDDHSRARHKLESLKELDQRRAHYSLAVQEAFSANQQEDFHLIGTLADSIQVDARWERAVEGVFGSSLQSILVPTPDDASRQQYVPIGIDGPRVGDILRTPPELLTVLERTLPERMNARIVDTLDDATALSLATGDMFVTTEGDWVAGGQLVNAGNGRALEEGAGLLTFQRELRELELRGNELAGELAVAEMSAKDARSRLTGLEESVVLLNASIAREEREAMSRELNASTLKQDVERAERHLRVVADDIARLSEERREQADRRANTTAEAGMAEAARRATGERIDQAGAVLANVRRQTEAENEILNQQRSEAAAAAERRRSTSSDLRRLEAEREDVTARLARHNQEIGED